MCCNQCAVIYLLQSMFSDQCAVTISSTWSVVWGSHRVSVAMELTGDEEYLGAGKSKFQKMLCSNIWLKNWLIYSPRHAQTTLVSIKCAAVFLFEYDLVVSNTYNYLE